MCETHTYCESSIKGEWEGQKDYLKIIKWLLANGVSDWQTALVQSPDNIVGVSQWERLNINLKSRPSMMPEENTLFTHIGSQDYVLILETCGHVTLHDKRMKVAVDLSYQSPWNREFIWYLGRSNITTRFFKVESIDVTMEERTRRQQCGKDLNCCCWLKK